MMTYLEKQLASYSSQHQGKRTILTHFVGIPLVILSLLVALSWVKLGAPFLIAALFFYLWSDFTLGLAAVVLLAPLYYLSIHFEKSIPAFLIFFVAGWALQLLGHHYEGKKPAFLHNIVQLLIGPLFLVVEILFALGLKKELKAKIKHSPVISRAAGASLER